LRSCIGWWSASARLTEVGAFNVRFEIGHPESDQWLALDALVDTGSTYTWVPRDLVEQIGLSAQFQREFETADGRVIVRDVAVARARLDGRILPTLVVIADPGDSALLGVVTLEEFGLGVDTVNQRLQPVRGLAMRRLLPLP
jgi:aspartyl protease family protein